MLLTPHWNRTPRSGSLLYDEQIYLQSLQKRRSPLGTSITALGWKSVAGFQKLSENPS
jgi:hypothetical protein